MSRTDRGSAQSGPALPRFDHDTPVVVLVVDVRTAEVVHPGGGLSGVPVPAAGWARSAGLTRPDGEPFAPGLDPVSRVAAGQPLAGERVGLAGGRGRRTMWATGVPRPTAGDERHSLLVLVDLDEPVTDDGAAVRDRAVVAAGLAFTIADARLPDCPLVFVNPAFERTTGYTWEEVRGRNCRFLQGPDTDPDAVQRVRDAVAGREHAVVTLLNHRKDGSPFWNELSLSPVYDGEGVLTHVVGIQADVTGRVRVEQERARHLIAEQRARADSERAQARLALLAEATSMLAGTLDVDEALRRLAALVVPVMADWCLVELVGEGDEDPRRVGSHVDPAKAELLAGADGLADRAEGSPTSEVLRTGRPLLYRDLADEDEVVASTGARSDTYRALGVHSGIVVPLRARDRVLGVLTMVSADSGRTYDEADLSMASDLARRAALAVDNARLYSREHAVAEQLQRSLLPRLPAVPGLDLAARYLPSSTAAQVGGDWYDLFELPDGAVGVAVGDVMGHDMQAAAAMGQLRSVLRSYAWTGSAPAEVLDHLDQLVQGLQMAQLATAVYGRLTLPGPAGPGRLVLANAGHLPPVLRLPGGATRLLDEASSLLVGAALGPPREELEVDVPSGSLLVLCTDGLLERRGLDPDVGLERLRAAVEAEPDGTAEGLCDALLAGLAGDDLDDDVALLVVRVL